MVATCHLVGGLKALQPAGLDPVTFGQGKRLGKGYQPTRHCMNLVIYMVLNILNFELVYGWRGGPDWGLAPTPGHI
jgi:hypothetical protein